MEMLAKPRTDKRSAYALIQKAAEMNNFNARAELAWAHVLGHWVEFNFEYAATEFDELAKEGLPEANMVHINLLTFFRYYLDNCFFFLTGSRIFIFRWCRRQKCEPAHGFNTLYFSCIR